MKVYVVMEYDGYEESWLFGVFPTIESAKLACEAEAVAKGWCRTICALTLGIPRTDEKEEDI